MKRNSLNGKIKLTSKTTDLYVPLGDLGGNEVYVPTRKEYISLSSRLERRKTRFITGSSCAVVFSTATLTAAIV